MKKQTNIVISTFVYMCPGKDIGVKLVVMLSTHANNDIVNSN